MGASKVLSMVLILVPMCLAAVPSSADKIRYGHIANSARSPASMSLNVAIRRGFLVKENIDLEVIPLPGLGKMIDALDQKTVDLSLVATPFLIEAVMRGSDAVGVVGGSATSIHSLIVKPEIKSFTQLKGKIIGLSTRPDTLSIATRLLLERHGLKENEYQVKEMQGTPIRLNCLLSGGCDGAALNQPEDLILLEKGYQKLGDSLEVMPELQFLVIAASRNWSGKNKDLMTRFARAYGNAYRYMRDPSNKKEIAQILTESTGVTEPIALAMLSLYFEPDRGALPKQAEISLRGVEKVIELLVETGQLAKAEPVDRFVDLQFLKAAGMQ